MTDPDAWVPLAEIARPHGVKGEVRLKLFNTSSDVLLEQDEVLVRLPSGTEHEVSIERVRRADDAILMKLFSIDNRDRADELRGALVCVRRRDFPAPEEGEFYTVDVVGSEVRLLGNRIGEIAEIITYPTVEAMLVRADDGEGDWEIPLTDTYIAKVDTAARVVEVLTLDELERLPTKDQIKAKKEKKNREKKERRERRRGVASNASMAADASSASSSSSSSSSASASSSSDVAAAPSSPSSHDSGEGC